MGIEKEIQSLNKEVSKLSKEVSDISRQLVEMNNKLDKHIQFIETVYESLRNPIRRVKNWFS
jgi:archaellum component FlaC